MVTVEMCCGSSLYTVEGVGNGVSVIASGVNVYDRVVAVVSARG